MGRVICQYEDCGKEFELTDDWRSLISCYEHLLTHGQWGRDQVEAMVEIVDAEIDKLAPVLDALFKKHDALTEMLT